VKVGTEHIRRTSSLMVWVQEGIVEVGMRHSRNGDREKLFGGTTFVKSFPYKQALK
jgi:hypothetical protein